MTQETLSTPAWRGAFDTIPASPAFSDNHVDTAFEIALHQPEPATNVTQKLGQCGVYGVSKEDCNDQEANGSIADAAQALGKEDRNDHEADDGAVIHRGLE